MGTTLGVFISWMLLRGTQIIAKIFGINSLVHTGNYGEPPSMLIWGTQLLNWLGIIFITKLIIGILIYCSETTLSSIGDWLFLPFKGHRDTELILVMILCPCFLNGVQ